jgi:hypothetical protein
MSAVIAIWNRAVQAIVTLYRSGLSSPDSFAPPPPVHREASEPAPDDDRRTS